ncbi:MAG: hypothetical protein HY056_08165 [Proteobacteria bacterium]|nr:hypothetical protein [Pseudomonadota bacterium]
MVGVSQSRKPTQAQLRQQRLQAALRENLKRRKAQARRRARPVPAAGATPNSAGFGDEKSGS